MKPSKCPRCQSHSILDGYVTLPDGKRQQIFCCRQTYCCHTFTLANGQATAVQTYGREAPVAIETDC